MARELPPRVYEKAGSYWHVRAVGDRRIWTKLCRVAEGLPTMYRKLADVEAIRGMDDAMPKVVADWLEEVSSKRSDKTQANDAYKARAIAASFKGFRASEVTPPDVIEFLRYYKDRERTYNAYRSLMRELMRFAEEKGYRPPGSNPVASLKTISIKPRDRYITDSELRRIKVGAMYGGPGQRQRTRNRSGPMICALIDMAYLTGQRVGDLIKLEWAHIDRAGVHFQPGKTAKSTGVRITVEWTPKLEELVARIKAMKRVNLRWVFTTQDGQKYSYRGVNSAWARALERAGVKDCHFHDIRAKALTDKDFREGMEQARTMGGHSTPNQTAAYVRHRTAKKTSATR